MVTISANVNGVTVSANVVGNKNNGYTVTFTAPPANAGHTQHVSSDSTDPISSNPVDGCTYVFTPSTNWGNISTPSQVTVTMVCSTG